MLRTAKHPHLMPLLQGFKFTTTAAGAATLNIGSEEATAVRAAAGKATITPSDPLSQEGVVIVSPGADVAAGAFGVYDTAHAESSLTAEMLNKAGTGDDGTGYCLTLGVEDDETIRCEPYQAVKNPAIQPRLLPMKLSAAGAVSIGASQASDSLASNAHTLTFTNSFGRAPVVVATPIAATAASVIVTSTGAETTVLTGFDNNGDAAADLAMYVAVLGWDIPDELAGHRRSVKIPQIAPRIEAYAIDGTGTASLGVGAEDGTLTDNGTGDYSVTFKQSFLREPIVLCTGKDYCAQCLAAATTTGFQVGAFDQGGAYAAVDDEIYVLVIGFDDETDS